MSLTKFLNTVSTKANQLGSALDAGQQFVNTFTGVINDFSNPAKLASALRSGSIPVGTEATTKTYNTGVWRVTDTSDWRVRLSIPPIPSFDTSEVLRPLYDSNHSMVWPTTPQITMSHTANYGQMTPIHSNYAFQMYQNSQIDDINISGNFPIDNESDGRYWVAAVHFLRSATKMFYGETTQFAGAPPPVLKLNGYGDFVFKDIPVVVKSFSIDLPNGVDYIRVPLSGTPDASIQVTTGNVAYVPTLSTLSVVLAVTHSRDGVRQFSLDKFVKGDYITQGKYI